MDLHTRFNRAANHGRLLARSLSHDQLLVLYGLYKQATAGENKTDKPSFIRMTERRKWDAWAAHRDKAQEIAMEEYIDAVAKFDPEFTPDAEPASELGVRVSSFVNDEAALEDSEKTLFDWVKENDGQKLRSAILAGADVTGVDGGSMTLLHWAADRGHAEVAELLLRAGADPVARDSEGQTALHYAASCGHEAVVRCLLAAGADPSAVDDDGCTPLDVAAAVVKELLSPG